jgi:hypothetical protein
MKQADVKAASPTNATPTPPFESTDSTLSPSPEPSISSASEALFSIAEGGPFWGGVGLVAGALAATVNMGWLFVAAWFAFVWAIIRGKPFLQFGKSWAGGLGNALLSVVVGVALFGLWRVAPKPKEPPQPPTLAEITASIKAQVPSNPSKAAASAPTQTLPPKTAPKRYTSGQPSVAKLPAATPAPQETQQPSQPPPQPGEHGVLTLTQTNQVSTRPDAPNHIRVVVQTTVSMPSLKLLVKCSGPLVEATPYTSAGGMLVMTGGGVVPADRTLIAYQYQSATPPFSPANPVIIDVWSEQPVTCAEARTF